jgi:peroxiredoxin
MKKFTGVLFLAAAMLIAFTAYTLSKGDKTNESKEAAAADVTAEAAVPMVAPNKPVPNFELVSAEGKKLALSQFAGKWVVMEWINFDCPFVKKHYGSHNMQNLQSAYVKKDVAWLTICSSAPEKQGYYEGETLTAKIKDAGLNSTAYLVDADGKVGRMFEAKTTPHMFIINPQGVLVYAGAIDDKPSTKLEDIEGATNYIKAALDAAMAGKEIQVASTTSYGCSVKY